MTGVALTVALVIQTFWGPRIACEAIAVASLGDRPYTVEKSAHETVYVTPAEEGDENGTHVRIVCGRWKGRAEYVG